MNRRVPYSLHGLLIVFWLSEEDAVNKRLRVSIVQWKPARLDLHHEAMSRLKHMIRRRKGKAIWKRFVRRNRPWYLQTFTITSAKDVGGNHELVATHLRIASDFVGVDINEFYYPVAISTAR